jgi:hypothetical protein
VIIPIDRESGDVAIVANTKENGAAARVEKRIDVFWRNEGDTLFKVAR